MNSHANTITPSTEPVLMFTQLNPYADEVSGYQDDNMKHKAEQVAQNNAAVRKMHAAKQAHNMEEKMRAFAALETLAKATPPFLPAVVNVAYCLREGLGTLPEIKRSVSLLEQAALNYAPAQTYLGIIYAKGAKGVKWDVEEAKKYLFKAVAQKHRGAAHELYWLFWEKSEDAKAIEYLKIAADQRDADAQCTLAMEYRSGKYIKQDEKEFAKYLTSSLQQNCVHAYYNAGLCSEEKSKKIEYFKKAAKFDDAASMRELASLCPDEKMQWLERAAKLGDADAIRECALATKDVEHLKLLAADYKTQPLYLLRDIQLLTGMFPYLPPGSLPVLQLNYKQTTEGNTQQQVVAAFEEFSQAMKSHPHPELRDVYCSVALSDEETVGQYDFSFILDIVAQLYSLVIDAVPEQLLEKLIEKLAAECEEQKQPSSRLMTLKITSDELSEVKATIWARALSKQTSLVELSLSFDISPQVAAILFAPFITIPNQPEDTICVELQSLKLEILKAEIIDPLVRMLFENKTLKTIDLEIKVDIAAPAKDKSDERDKLEDAIAQHPTLTDVAIKTASFSYSTLLAKLNRTSSIQSLRCNANYDIKSNPTALRSLYCTSDVWAPNMLAFVKANPQLQSLRYSVAVGDPPTASAFLELIRLNKLAKLEVNQYYRMWSLQITDIEKALENNTTLTELQSDQFSPSGEYYNKEDPSTVNIKNRLQANKLKQDTKILDWSRICFAIAFVGANQTSALCRSFLALLPDIDQYQFGNNFRSRLFKRNVPHQQTTASAPAATPSAPLRGNLL